MTFIKVSRDDELISKGIQTATKLRVMDVHKHIRRVSEEFSRKIFSTPMSTYDVIVSVKKDSRSKQSSLLTRRADTDTQKRKDVRGFSVKSSSAEQ